MNKIRFSEYYDTASVIHKIDPRVKIIVVIIYMISLFLIPQNNIIMLFAFLALTLLLIILTKVPLIKYLKSIKHILFLLIFTFIFQVIFREEGKLIYELSLTISLLNLVIVLVLLLLLFFLAKYLKFRMLIFLAILALAILMFHFNLFNQKSIKDLTINIYDQGLISAIFIVVRVMTLIMFSNILTLTTKSTDLNNAIESLLKPLEKLKIKTPIFAMMISIAVRFIPTLFNELDRILKAQASRGSDFNEGSLRQKIKQVISILIPMFIISFKRADDLSLAMEARGYVPGAPRTKINALKMHIYDYLVLSFFLALFIALIILRVIL